MQTDKVRIVAPSPALSHDETTGARRRRRRVGRAFDRRRRRTVRALATRRFPRVCRRHWRVLSAPDGGQYASELTAGGGGDEGVPDRGLEPEAFPQVEPNADRVERAAGDHEREGLEWQRPDKRHDHRQRGPAEREIDEDRDAIEAIGQQDLDRGASERAHPDERFEPEGPMGGRDLRQQRGIGAGNHQKYRGIVEAAQQSLRGRRRREIVGAGTDEQQEKGRGVHAHGKAVAPTSIQRHLVEQNGKGDESGYDRRRVNDRICDFFIDADPTWRWDRMRGGQGHGRLSMLSVPSRRWLDGGGLATRAYAIPSAIPDRSASSIGYSSTIMPDLPLRSAVTSK